MLSLSVWICGLSVIPWRRLLWLSVYEIADESPSIWKFAGEVDQTVPGVERTPRNDCQLYDLILLLRQIELHGVGLLGLMNLKYQQSSAGLE